MSRAHTHDAARLAHGRAHLAYPEASSPSVGSISSRWRLAGLTLFGAFALTACAADVGEGKTVAEVHEPATTAPVEPAAGKVVKVDNAQSKLGGVGAKITAQHPFTFSDYEGTVTVDGDKVTAIHFSAKVASINADDERLTGHLKKEDFLFVDQYPDATFDSTKITEGSDVAGNTHTVTGNLTIRGVTKEVSFPAKIENAGGKVTANTEFVINRQDFKVTYPGKPDDLVQDNVVLQVSFVAPVS